QGCGWGLNGRFMRSKRPLDFRALFTRPEMIFMTFIAQSTAMRPFVRRARIDWRFRIGNGIELRQGRLIIRLLPRRPEIARINHRRRDEHDQLALADRGLLVAEERADVLEIAEKRDFGHVLNGASLPQPTDDNGSAVLHADR